MFELGILEQLPAASVDGVTRRPLPHEPAAILAEIGALEDLVNAARARQARLAVELAQIRAVESMPRRDLSRDEERARLRRDRIGVGAEVARARRISPHAGARFLSLAKVLIAELPHTWAAFEAGQLSERRARSVAAGTACLSLEHRRAIDAAVASDPTTVRAWGDRALESAVRSRAAELDPAGVVEAIRRAEGDRRVTLRPGHDHMTHLHAVLPIREGVACLAALKAAATRAVAAGRASGEPVSHSQAMADALVARLTGRDPADPESVAPIALRLVMTADSLFGADDAPAALTDGLDHATWHDAIPAALARSWVCDDLDAGRRVMVKRLFAAPGSGELIAMESRARCFPPALGEFIAIRDGWCRTPFCNAPIRHLDHIRRHADGGPTSAANGRGLCVQCNQAEEAAHSAHSGHSPPPPSLPGPLVTTGRAAPD